MDRLMSRDEVEIFIIQNENRFGCGDAIKIAKQLDGVMRENERLKVALNPRQWDRETNDAWHRAIPDLYAAFAAINPNKESAHPTQNRVGHSPTCNLPDGHEYPCDGVIVNVPSPNYSLPVDKGTPG